jgi:hypothetical protein
MQNASSGCMVVACVAHSRSRCIGRRGVRDSALVLPSVQPTSRPYNLRHEQVPRSFVVWQRVTSPRRRCERGAVAVRGDGSHAPRKPQHLALGPAPGSVTRARFRCRVAITIERAIQITRAQL